MYLARLREIVDADVIRKAGLRVVFDPLWGAARGYSDTLLREAGVSVATVHDYRDVLFGGHAPEPDDHLLEDLRKKMRETKAHIGIATDGDADRFGIVDEDGTFFQPNYIIALLFDYLVESRGWKNGVGKSVATTNLINALAKHHQVELRLTPVGFRFRRGTDQTGQDLHWRGRTRGCRSGIMFRKKTGCWLACCVARWWRAGASLWVSNWRSYLAKLVPSVHKGRTSSLTAG